MLEFNQPKLLKQYVEFNTKNIGAEKILRR